MIAGVERPVQVPQIVIDLVAATIAKLQADVDEHHERRRSFSAPRQSLANCSECATCGPKIAKLRQLRGWLTDVTEYRL